MKKLLKNGMYLVLLPMILLSLTHLYAHQTRVRVYSFYTPSHTIFKDTWFLPTFGQDDTLDIIIKEFPQECPSGKVWTEGWQKAMLRKVDLILDAIEENWGTVFIYSDVDVQLLRYPLGAMILNLMGEDMDVMCQRDTPSGTLCAGFMVIRGNERTKALWQAIRTYMVEEKERSDQKTLNQLLRKGSPSERNRFKVVWDYLPVEFLGGGTFTGSGWSPGKSLFVPSRIVLHHANWTTGNPHKLAQLEYVRKKVRSVREAAVAA